MALRTILAAGFFCACSLLATTAPLAADDQLPWAANFAIACQQAQAEGKLVLLHFYSDDCPPCVGVEKKVFSQAEVGAAVGRSFVPVKVHARKTPELVTRYNVRQWPTDVFVTPAGLELTRSVSPQSPTQYVSMVNSVAATAGVGIAKANATATIAQVSNQANAQYNYLTNTATTSAQQFQQSAAQAQQSAQQAAQQSWQYAQQQTNQAVANTQQAAQQGYAAGTQAVAAGTQNVQQQTQAAAESAKEVINQYSQPFQQASAAASTWQPPFAAGAAPASPAIDASVQQHYGVPQQPVQSFVPPTGPPAAQNMVAPPQQVASGAYPIAMEGYCPVTLAVERKWKKGQPQFGAVHRRRTFLFSSAAEQEKFLTDPDRYSPVMVGYDPVKFMQTGELVDGRANFSLTYRKQVYLFTDDTALKSFWQNPSQFTEGLRQAILTAEGRTIR